MNNAYIKNSFDVVTEVNEKLSDRPTNTPEGSQTPVRHDRACCSCTTAYLVIGQLRLAGLNGGEA